MSLEKDDLIQIRKIVREEVGDAKNELDDKIINVKKEIIDTLSQEISDLSDINRASFVKMDQFDGRLRIVERKSKIGA